LQKIGNSYYQSRKYWAVSLAKVTYVRRKIVKEMLGKFNFGWTMSKLNVIRSSDIEDGC
jgi:hypothetical protein